MDEYDLTIKDLPQTKCLAIIKNRPWAIQISFTLLSLVFFFVNLWYIGVFLFVICILSIIVTPDYLACKVFADELAIFNPKNPEELRIVKFADIISFEMDNKAMSYVMLTVKGEPDPTIDQKNISVHSFQAGKLNRKLRQLIPDKDGTQIRMKQLQSNRLSNKEIKELKRKQREEEAAE